MDEYKTLVWLDCEMTGLDPNNDMLLEVAAVITDAQLNVIAKGPNIVLHQPRIVLDSMNAWCQEQHKKSGLTERVLESSIDVGMAQAEMIGFLRKNTSLGNSILCGNSIAQDRKFLKVHMPELEMFFHYRMIDVSTIKELVKRWYPNDNNLPYVKQEVHRAYDDIMESIAELRFYREHFFKA
jgi:oligoribonuclease